jgi:uncharacterized membrane protein
MVSVQRSIEIKVPVHALYDQLTQFENYPQFMQDIESVEQRDDTHLHWTARMRDKPVEWDAAITECVPDRCIAWQSENGPGNAGKVELQAVGPAASRLTLTIVSEMDFEPTTPAGDVKAEFSERIWEDLARLRTLMESRQQQDGHETQASIQASGRAGRDISQSVGPETGPVADLGIAQGTGRVGNAAGREGIDEVAELGSIEGSAQGEADARNQATPQTRHAPDSVQRDRGSPGNPVPVSGLTADQEASPLSASPPMVQQRSDAAGAGAGTPGADITELSRGRKNPTQADYSLSKNSPDGMQGSRDSIAEEVNFDQQSDFARHVGQLSSEDPNGDNQGVPNPDVIDKAAHRNRPEPEV